MSACEQRYYVYSYKLLEYWKSPGDGVTTDRKRAYEYTGPEALECVQHESHWDLFPVRADKPLPKLEDIQQALSDFKDDSKYAE